MHVNDRILVIDDNVDNLMILQELLEDEYTVRCATTGDEGLAIAPEFKPNLVLLDAMMPGISGNERLRRVPHEPRIANVEGGHGVGAERSPRPARRL